MALEFIKPTYSPVKSVNGQTGDVIIEIPSHEGLATEQYVNEKIEQIDLSPFATQDELERAVANVKVDLTGYATEDFVNEAVANVKVDVDLTGYATEEYVNEAIRNIDIPEGGEGISESRVNELIDERNYITTDDVNQWWEDNKDGIKEDFRFSLEESLSENFVSKGEDLEHEVGKCGFLREEQVIELIEQYGGSGGENLPAAEEVEF